MEFLSVRRINTKISKCVTALVFSGSISLTQAAEIPTDPGDYLPLPAGTDLLVFYLQHNHFNAYYSDGKKQAGDFEMASNVGILRYVHYMELGGFIINPQVVVPFGEIQLKKPFAGLSEMSITDVGDPMLAATTWLYNNPETRRYIAMSTTAVLPLGGYDGDRGPINMGANRWSGIFHLAYVTPVTAKSMFELVTEYAVYGKNDDFLGMTQKRDDFYGVQGHLSYTPVPGSRFGVSYFHDYGGETELNGVSQGDKLDNSRWLLSAATQLTADTQLLLQYGDSIKVENGPYERQRVNLRLVKVF